MQKKKILILDCGSVRDHIGGKLNHWFADSAMEELQNMGHEVEITIVEEPYEVAAEVEKILAADVIILQTPSWWMSPPWTFKKYEDEVFMEKGIFGGSGRHKDNPAKGYGTGGILTDKQYMISSTWNAPIEAFTDPNEFFGGKGVDEVFLPVHKTFQFLGMKPLPSFLVVDVHEDPSHQQDMERWKAHLKKVLG